MAREKVIMTSKTNGEKGRPTPPERRHDGASSIDISRRWAFTGKVPMDKNTLQQT